MKNLVELSTNELLNMYESEIQRLHYDPCDSYDRAPFDSHELRKEIERRLTGESMEEHNDFIESGFAENASHLQIKTRDVEIINGTVDVKAPRKGTQPVAKVGYMKGHYEAGLQVEILDHSRISDGMLLYPPTLDTLDAETKLSILSTMNGQIP